jgi:DNA-3-methyladenine glycosylase II
MAARVSYDEAAQVLAGRDPVLARLIDEAGPIRISRSKMSPFESLVQAIVYQQLAGAAARAIHGRLVATKVLDGTVIVAPRRLARLSDDEVAARLTTVRGIGPWSAHMFLIFQLRRLDIWPVGDLGVRQGFGLAWGIAQPTQKELEPLGEPFRPYRTVVAWYCWRAAELYAGAGASALTR